MVGFTWGQDALTGKQTHVIPAEIWNRSVSCWGCSVNPVYHRVPLMEKCLFIHGNTQRPPWILRPVKMLVLVTLRNDKLGVLVHRLGLCFTQVKLWAAFLHSSGRNLSHNYRFLHAVKNSSSLVSEERVDCPCFLALRIPWCAGSNFLFWSSARKCRCVEVGFSHAYFAAVPAPRVTG